MTPKPKANIFPFARQSQTEWVGDRRTAPMFVSDHPDGPYRPEMFVWIQLPEHVVVAAELFSPHDPKLSATDSLRKAMNTPLAGPARQPTRIRLSNGAMLEELASEFLDIQFELGPTPEIDHFFESLAQDGPRGESDDETYLGNPSISEARIASFFEAAAKLYEAEPWTFISEQQVIRVDVPVLDIIGGCLVVIGGNGEEHGVLLFDDFEEYRRFELAAAVWPEKVDGPGVPLLSLSFSSESEIPPAQRSEIASYNWPIAGPDAYPLLFRADADRVVHPHNDHDFRLMTGLAKAFASFSSRRRERFETGELGPVTVTLRPAVPDGQSQEKDEFRFTYPYHAGPGLGLEPTPSGPTGSSHAVFEKSPRPAWRPEAGTYESIVDELDDLGAVLGDFALGLYGQELLDAAVHDFAVGRDLSVLSEEDTRALWVPWMSYEWIPSRGYWGQEYRRIRRRKTRGEPSLFNSKPPRVPLGRLLLEHILQIEGDNRMTDLLQSLLASRFSFWEVREMIEGISVGLKDRFTGKTVEVLDPEASKSLDLLDVLYARVTGVDDTNVIWGNGVCVLSANQPAIQRLSVEIGPKPTAARLRKFSDEIRGVFFDVVSSRKAPR